MSNNLSSIKVPHYGPEDAKILFVGEAPGDEEQSQGKPFVGVSGEFIRNTLLRYGFNPDEARWANICNYHPLNNNFNFVYRTPEFEEGKRELAEFIEKRKPNIIVPLGREALSFLCGKSGNGAITTWRGSIIPCIFRPEIKCVATYHPSYVLRDQTNIPAFDLDIKRIVDESKFPEFNYTERSYYINPEGLELLRWVEVLSNSEYLGTDIESSRKTKQIICVGFAPNPTTGVVIFADTIEGRKAIHDILSSQAKKVFHFGIFDNLMLRREGYEVNNYFGDTYIAQRVLNAEQPNSLGYLTSLYTREPYYKTEGRATIPSDTKVWGENKSKHELGIYNAKDSCCTIEIFLEQQKELEEEKLTHVFVNNMEQQEMAIHVSESGVLIDEERRHLIERALLKAWNKKQQALNFLCGEVVNVSSPKLKNVLYTKLGLPERKKRNKDGKWVVTTDEDAIVATLAFIKNNRDKLVKDGEADKKWEIKEAVCKLIIQIRGIRKVLSTYIKVKSKVNTLYGADYRARSTYKDCGAETLRYSAEMFVDDTGVNGQTFPREGVVIPEDIDKTDDSILTLIREVEQINIEEIVEEEMEAA